MSLLEDLTAMLNDLNIPVETGVFSDEAPDEYAVITPISENFTFFADDTPQSETQEALISLYSKNNYIPRKNEIARKILELDMLVTERRYVEYEIDSGYHHYVIGAANIYDL